MSGGFPCQYATVVSHRLENPCSKTLQTGCALSLYLQLFACPTCDFNPTLYLNLEEEPSEAAPHSLNGEEGWHLC